MSEPPFTGMTTEELHDRIRALARDFAIEERYLPLIYYPDNGAAYVFVDEQGLKMGYYERGSMFDCRVSRDLDDLLYWVFDRATFQIACERARPGITHVRQFGPRVLEAQAALLEALDAQWYARWLRDDSCEAGHYRREAQH